MAAVTRAEQRADALRVATEVRARRAQLRRNLRGLPPDVAARDLDWLLITRPWWLATLPTEGLVAMLPGFGPAAVRRALRTAGVRGDVTVERLTDRQARGVGEAVDVIVAERLAGRAARRRRAA